VFLRKQKFLSSRNLSIKNFPSIILTAKDLFFLLNVDPRLLRTTKKISDFEIQENTIYFKDLGPQISWKLVFLIEYFGPLVLYPLFTLQPSFLYGTTSSKLQFPQILGLICWSVHYFKREIETLFIHRFSHGTMPLSNLVKNCSYYWGNAALVAYFVNHPLYTSPSPLLVYLGLGIFVVSECGNLITHIMLKNLRPAGTTERRIPRGFLFDYVSCPNYTFEVLAWFGFSLMTQTLTAYIFAIIGAAQMTAWAVKKHRQYRKEFPDYPKSRKIIIPFLY
jgi:very-long-chain enoyl-CoA reductase